MAVGEGAPRVLVLDDDADMRTLLRDILMTEGFDPVIGDADAPLESLLRQRPGLVLLDYVMSSRGDELVNAARRGRFGRVPVVLVSAIDDIERRASEIGAAAYVAKPFDIDDLVHTCRTTATAA